MLSRLRTHDCAKKVRMRYYFETPFSRSLFDLFPGCNVKIDAFSTKVAGASDHFSMILEDEWIVTGAYPGSEIVVTFWKSSEEIDPPSLASFEGSLLKGGFGEIRELF